MTPIEAIEFNVNDYVWIRLTPKGQQIYRQKYSLRPMEMGYDSDGWLKMQLWEVMQCFGPHILMGFDPCFETTIRFDAHNLKVLEPA
jgi:hypothetical protein